jgi:hypothetical protein
MSEIETTAPATATTTAPAIAEMPLQYLDKAVGAIRNLGIWPEQQGEAPITGLLQQITELDETRVLLIGRTLSQASAFNEVVREQIAAMKIAERYEEITKGFDSIRDDAKTMVDQLADNRLDLVERVQNVWMKVSRGDIASRFNKIRDTYLTVTADTKDQIEREQTILEAYRDFRGALKQAEVMALEVLHTAEQRLGEKKTVLEAASAELAGYQGDVPADRARLEMARDERLREMQNEEKRYQIAKDLSDNLTISYNTTEVVMARLMQTTNAKERVYQQSISFFSTNETVLDCAQRLLHRHVRAARIDPDAERHEGRHVQEPRDPVRDRRQGAGRGGARRLRSHHPRRCGQEAGRFRHQLPGKEPHHHQRDARRLDQELGRDPRCGRGRQAPPRPARQRGQCALARNPELIFRVRAIGLEP